VRVGVRQKRLKHVSLKVIVFGTSLLFSAYSQATVYQVINANDNGTGSLRDAINQVNTHNAGGDDVINISAALANGTINLASPLPPINITGSVNIYGSAANNFTINGQNAQSIFFVYQGTVNISTLTLHQGKSTGGAGGSGSTGGGGGMGAGGAVFVNGAGTTGGNVMANVTLTDVQVTGNNATGGAGGTNTGFLGSGGGGGFGGGAGGNGGANIGGGNGGGGGFQAAGGAGSGSTAAPGTAGTNGTILGTGGGGAGAAGQSGTTSGGGVGGLTAGGGGGGGFSNASSFSGGGGGGGGIGGSPGSTISGGAGGAFGGSGGTSSGNIGPGANGGYGGGSGGGGSNPNNGNPEPGLPGFGGGQGGQSRQNGNGGSGFGGAVFVAGGGHLTIKSSNTNIVFSGNTVNPGAGASNGQALGSDFYFDTGANVTFDVAEGFTQTIGVVNQATSIAGTAGFTKSSGGTLILQGTNNTIYTEPLLINDGVLQIDAQSATTGQITNNASLVFNTAAGTAGNFNGTIIGSGSVTKQGDAGAITLMQAQTYAGITTISTGSLQLNGANFLPNTTAINIAANASLFTSGFSQTIHDLTGATNSRVDLGGAASTFTFGTNNADKTFAGVISGTGSIVKTGTNTVTLSGNNSYAGATTINGGNLKIAGINGNIASTQPIAIGNGTVLEMNGGTLSGSAPIQGGAGSQLLVTGVFTPGGAITNVPLINVNGGGNLTLAAASIPTGFTTFNVTGNATGTATLNLNSPLTIPPLATMTVSGTATNNGIVNLTALGGSITNNGTAVTGGLVVQPNGVINGPGAITNNTIINYAGGNINAPVTGGGNSSIIVTADSTTGNTIDSVRNITVQAGTLTIATPVTNFTNLTIDAHAGLTLGANLDMSNATLNDNGTLNLGTFQLSGNGGSILNINNDFNTVATGTIANIGTINVNSGTYTMNAAPIGFQHFNILTPGRVTLATNLALPANSTVTIGGVLTMGTYTLSSAPNANTTLNITVPFTNTAAITDISNINVNNGGIYTMNVAPTGFNAMTVALGGIMNLGTNLTMPAAAALTTAGTFDMNQNNIIMNTNSSLTINGPLSTSGTITGDGTYPVVVNAPNGIFTVNNAVSGYGAFTIMPNSITNLTQNGSLTGDVTVGGTLNLNGGTLVSGALAGNGFLNVNAAFTAPGNLNVATVTINNGGTLTTIDPITAVNGLTIATGGTLILNQGLTGSLTQNGALINPQGVPLTITGDYIMGNTAARTVQISTSSNDTLQVTGNATINGGTIIVELPGGGGDIGYNQAFNIVSVGGGAGNALTVNQLPAVAVPHSLLAHFDLEANGNDLQLISRFVPIASLDPGLDGITESLNAMRGSPAAQNLGPVYSAIDSAETSQELEELLNELAPLGRNMETVAATCAIQNLMSDKILGRMSDARTTGYAAGDMANGSSSYGPFVFGNGLRQGVRNGVAGYNATTGGFGLLWDKSVLQNSRLGAALAYGASVVRQDDETRNMIKINNATATIYGNADYGPLFLDGLVSMGRNFYYSKRHIVPMNVTATAHYQGMQYGSKIRGGFTLPVYTLEISPMATGQYILMNVQRYTEQNAPGANLTVADTKVSNLQMGLGARIAEVSQSDEFLPEIHALYLYDLKPAKLQVTSQFATGGLSFVTTGPLPPRAGVNIGGSLTAKLKEDFIFIGGYDIEVKKSFVSQSLTLKARWLF